MLDYRHRGYRVKIKPGIVTFYRRYKGNETGTIICELDNNLGRTLVDVEWAGIGQSPVFLEELIFLDKPEPSQ